MQIRLPEEPPINTWVGAGSSFKASGASPGTIVRLSRANFRRFSSRSSTASSFFSMAQTSPLGHCLAISTETEPVPAPTSQQMESSSRASLEREMLRMPCFVIGTFARRNTSSERPWVVEFFRRFVDQKHHGERIKKLSFQTLRRSFRDLSLPDRKGARPHRFSPHPFHKREACRRSSRCHLFHPPGQKPFGSVLTAPIRFCFLPWTLMRQTSSHASMQLP